MATSTRAQALIPFLVAMMLVTGVCNTLLTKYQDIQCVEHCSDPKRRRNFEQPVWQTVQMFIGEAGCFLVIVASSLYTRFVSGKATSGYQPLTNPENPPSVPTAADDAHPDSEIASAGRHSIDEEGAPITKTLNPNHPEQKPMTGFRVMLLALPAICDITGTTLMNVGLLFLPPSIYQMMRGSLVLFVGLFSVMFLKKRLGFVKWTALILVVAGVALVGLAGIVERHGASIPGGSPVGDQKIGDLVVRFAKRGYLLVTERSETAPPAAPVAQTVLGIFLIALGQIFAASQFVLEESIMSHYSISPLGTVSWEGTFGLIFTLLFLFIMNFAYGRTPAGKGGYFDAAQGWKDMTGHPAVLVSSFLIMISIGGFNFFGLSVTRTVSATSRSTIDTSRTLFVWLFSLGLGWETFKWLQVVGFALLVYGTFLFNEIIRPPTWRYRRGRQTELLPERPIEHN